MKACWLLPCLVATALSLAAGSGPDGSSFVPVHWHFDASKALLSGLLAAELQEAELQLSVGGHERSLPAPYTAAGKALATNPATTFYVVLPGTPRPQDVDLFGGL